MCAITGVRSCGGRTAKLGSYVQGSLQSLARSLPRGGVLAPGSLALVSLTDPSGLTRPHAPALQRAPHTPTVE